MPTSYRNFDLLIGRESGGYATRVVQSPLGETTATPFYLPFQDEELSSFFWIQGRGGMPIDGASSNALDPRTFGARLYETIFAGVHGSLFERNLEAALSVGEGLRLRLRLIEVPELADLPWEYLYAPPLERYLALSQDTPIVRYVEMDRSTTLAPVDPPLNVLTILANPGGGVALLDVEKEWQNLQKATVDLQTSHLLRLEKLERATPEALQDRLRGEDVHILHFVGHGFFDAEAESGGLVLEGADGEPTLLDAGRFATMLQDHESLRLVFLNACEGGRGGRSDPFSGVAQSLVRQGLPAVLAMQFEVEDQVATRLSHDFYRALGAGYALDGAVVEGRKALYASGDDLAWGAPVFFSRSSENRLVSAEGAPQVIERQPFEPEMIFIPAGTFWMGATEGDADVEPWEQPGGEVHLPPFQIGKYPITNREYHFFVRESGADAPRRGWIGRKPRSNYENHPVVGVSWDDAQAYCQWLAQKSGRAYRLPSEAEWEKAARGSDDRRIYPWGDEFDPDRCNGEGRRTAPVDAYPAQSPSGCFDMVGNVRQWTRTLWGGDMHEERSDFPYPWQPDRREALDEAAAFARAYRIHRGGAAGDGEWELRCSARGWSALDTRNERYGFRVVIPVGR